MKGVNLKGLQLQPPAAYISKASSPKLVPSNTPMNRSSYTPHLQISTSPRKHGKSFLGLKYTIPRNVEKVHFKLPLQKVTFAGTAGHILSVCCHLHSLHIKNELGNNLGGNGINFQLCFLPS